MPARFRLQTLGGLSLSACDSGNAALVNQRKRLAFVAALAAEVRSGISRERLFALFWPESDSERARNTLNQMVFAVRRDLGDDVILGDAVAIRLNSAVVDSDVRVFRDAVSSARFADAIDAYRGPFLDGVFLRDTPEFERWAEDVRHALAIDYRFALERETDAALSAGPSRASDAVRYARLLVACDPLSTQGALRLIRALERSGDTAAAHGHAGVHAARVRAELGSEPGPELERELVRLRTNGSPATKANVEQTPKSERGSQAQSPTVTEYSPDNEALAHPKSDGRTARRFWSIWRARWVGAIAASALAVIGVAYGSTRGKLDPHRVVIATFDNETGDSTLDDFGRVAADVITEQLARAGFVSVVDPATAFASSRQLQGRGARLGNGPALQTLARDTRARLVVTGSYFRDGDSLVAQARVTDATTNDVLAATEPVRAPLAEHARLLEPLRERVMGALALRVDERFAAIASPRQPPTYEAYRAFVAGIEMLTSGRFRKSAPYLHQAYMLDTSFFEPLIWEAYALQTSPKVREIIDILDRRRADLSEIDRFALEFHRASISDDLDKALTAARNAARLAPGSHWTLDIASVLFRLGRAREAADVWATVDLNQSWLNPTGSVSWAYVWALHDAGLHRQELDRVRDARARFPENANLRTAEAIALAVNGRWDELNLRLDSLEVVSPDAIVTVGSELRVHGDGDHAKAVFRRCDRWFASPPPASENGADPQAVRAHLLYDCGRWSEAVRLLDSLESDRRQPTFTHELWVRWLGVARARLGDRARAVAVMDRIANDSSSNTFALFDAARIAALLGERDRAVSLLKSVRNLPGDWLHYDADAGDFESLVGYPPYELLRSGR